ncbi:MAG TPA: aspartate aminotransferase family protein [Planctomycetaceae bacterium]|nr:aspartate aminotransferase family protein [Planctomycetaceae bacterium]
MFDLKALLTDERGHLALLSEERINPALCKALKVLGYNKQYVRGKGAYLFDEAGNRYVDCLSGFGTFACGRNHPAIREALKQAMDLDLPNLVAMGVASLSGLLARELIKIAPGQLDMVFFTNSGTEGVETAIKYSRAATGKSRIIHCKRSFHGLSLGSLSVNGNEEFKEGFGPMLEPVTAVPFNDLAALERELARGDVAGFIVEPIQGKGVFVPSDNYLPEAAALCRKHKAIFIADEVQTGLGRTGKMFACEHWGVEPDILIVAKALSGGYMPVGAVLSKRWIHEKVFSRLDRCFVHSSTFTENDLAMAAGLATLSVLRDEKLVENAASMGARLAEGLRSVGRQYEMFGEVRGRGLMIGIEFRPPTSLTLKMGWNLLHSLDPSLFCQAMLIPLLSEHHVLAQVAGHHLDVIKLLPSLVINQDDVDYLVRAFDQVMAACHRFPGPVWEVGKRLAGAQLRSGN